MASTLRHADLYRIDPPADLTLGEGAHLPGLARRKRRGAERLAATPDDVAAPAPRSGRLGFFMATLTALVFWAVVALMILFVVI